MRRKDEWLTLVDYFRFVALGSKSYAAIALHCPTLGFMIESQWTDFSKCSNFTRRIGSCPTSETVLFSKIKTLKTTLTYPNQGIWSYVLNALTAPNQGIQSYGLN